MIVIGVDPGLTGGLAVIDDGQLVAVYDMPVKAITYKGKTRKEVDGAELNRLFNLYVPAYIFIEKVSAMPGQGVTSMFRFGQSLGVIQGAADAFWSTTSVELVSPQKWKKNFKLIGTKKDAAREKCIEIFNSKKNWFKLKKSSGKADATLLGLYGYLQNLPD